MSTSLTRRKLVAGAAWAAPVVAASATIPSYAASVSADCTLAAHPAYNISGTDEGAKTVQSFAVPNNVYKLRFELVGGAGGTNNRMTPAGSGAKVTGIIPVTPGSTVQIIAAAGGIGDGSLTPPPAVKATATAAPYPPTPSPPTSLRRSTQSTLTRQTPRARSTPHPVAAPPRCSSTAPW